MPLVPDLAEFQKNLAALPVSTYQPGETLLAAGSTTGQLLVLQQGVVEVTRDRVPIAKISEPGAVFGELAVLLDKPHTADVRPSSDRISASPTRERCSPATWPPRSTSPLSWHGVSTARTPPSPRSSGSSNRAN